MSRVGADIPALQALKGVFDEQGMRIDELKSTITSRLGGVYWEGPARVRFESEWQAIQPALSSLQQSLQAAGTEAHAVAGRIQAAGS